MAVDDGSRALDERVQRIAEMIKLLEAGHEQRPKPAR
jgi:hypothetical protein